MQKVYFRADASDTIGYGHFTRSLALADILKAKFECVFFSQCPTQYQKEEVSKVCELVELPTDDTKFPVFLNHLTGSEIVVLDNYFFNTDYQSQIKTKGCRVVCIDDMHDKHYVADVVINHVINDVSLFNTESYTVMCLGLEWALLRKPFLNFTNQFQRQTGHCIVSFGGADKLNLTYKIISTIHKHPSIKSITAIIGDAYKYEESLKKFQIVEVVKNIKADQIVELFSKAELAILPCSTIAIEAIACKCPVISGYYIDNQVEFVKSLADQGYVKNIGDFTSDNLESSFNNLDISGLRSMSSIDTANNYVDLFEKLSFKFINYTDLTNEESICVWQTRNEFEIRQYMSNSEPFDFESHQNFINSLKSDLSKRYWAVFFNEVFIGGYNIVNISDNQAERGIFIDPQHLGKNYASWIERILDYQVKTMGITHLKAEVLRSNIKSIKYHKKMGYNLEFEDDQYFYYKRKI